MSPKASNPNFNYTIDQCILVKALGLDFLAQGVFHNFPKYLCAEIFVISLEGQLSTVWIPSEFLSTIR